MRILIFSVALGFTVIPTNVTEKSFSLREMPNLALTDQKYYSKKMDFGRCDIRVPKRNFIKNRFISLDYNF